jgi:hypothetical protein
MKDEIVYSPYRMKEIILKSLNLMIYNSLQLQTSFINELGYKLQLNKKYSIWKKRRKYVKEKIELIIQGFTTVSVNRKSILFGPKTRDNQFIPNNYLTSNHLGSSFKVKMKIHYSGEAMVSCLSYFSRWLLYILSMSFSKSPPIPSQMPAVTLDDGHRSPFISQSIKG